MKVFELAREWKTTPEVILKKLKSLKLKAKDKNQELSKLVLDVLRREMKDIPTEAPAPQPPPKKEAPAKPVPAKDVKEKKPRATRAKKKETAPGAAPPAKKKTETAEKAKPTAKPRKKVPPTPFVSVKPLTKRRKRPVRGREDAAKAAPAEPPAGAQTPAVTSADAPAKDFSLESQDLKVLELPIPISVKDFATAVRQKTNVVLKKLMDIGIFANINQNLGEDLGRRLAEAFGYRITKIHTPEQELIERHLTEEENPDLLKPRAPVVTLMGHVDHGKTSLLDRIRRSTIVDTEHGGITQHIGAYSVAIKKGKITFLDTPGHEAFTAMRARGAHITDLVILVVAADEGIMPQTEEAIDHARAANVPIVVALNKIDRRNADPEKVKKQLAERDLNPEDWGGKTIVAPVSAVTGEGIDHLLEMMLLEAELLELKANPEKKASGIVVEAHLNPGKGAVASLIVQSGTLRLGDTIVVGPYYGKIKAMFDDSERPIEAGGPSTPVEILGLTAVPEAGEMFYAVNDDRQAKEIAGRRKEKLKNEKLQAGRRITLEDLYSQIKEGSIKELNVILKADVQGSAEALKDALTKIPSDEVKVKFIHTGVGEINASDVILAVASNAIIIGFQVDTNARAKKELEKEPVDVRKYRIIYDAVNDVKKALEGLLEPRKRRKFLARIEVRQVFKLSKAGVIAGCHVTKGKVTRKAMIDVVRNGEVVHSGTISSLKRFKDDVREVNEGYECGISIDQFDKFQSGDILEAYELETIERKL